MSEIEVQNNSAKYYSDIRYQGYGLKYHTYVIKNMIGELNGTTLDVGCGTGIVSRIYHNCDIRGIDASPEMLNFGYGNRIQASAEDIPYTDNSFDNIVCRSLLHHLEAPILGLKEMYRVLKPGGNIFIWETNKALLADLVRKFTHHGDRFSEQHCSFSDLPQQVGKFFKIKDIKYEGFIAYGYGFPDIIDLSWIPGFGFWLKVDEFLSKTPLKKLGFAVRIRATK